MIRDRTSGCSIRQVADQRSCSELRSTIAVLLWFRPDVILVWGNLMRVTLKRSLMSIALSLFTIGNLSSLTALTAVLAGVGILSTLQTASATSITGGGYRASLEAYSFENITSADSVLNNDNSTALLPTSLNFSFRFFGVDYNRFQVSSNGFLALGTSTSPPATDSRPENLNLNSLTTNIGPTIAAFWDDLDFGGSYGTAFYAVRGTQQQGDRRLIVQWNQAGVGGTNNGGDITFQAVLFENSGDILLSYADTFFGSGVANNNGGSATVGISDGQPNGQRLQWSYNTPFSGYAPPQTGPTIRFRRITP
ncbi:hypothetical protein LEP3755_44160 [Leptolyngbya sp. NIES-3755]|nr:hypothetical protein LEP3755_44160 [Leptolyngbya sp. NIES-3755]